MYYRLERPKAIKLASPRFVALTKRPDVQKVIGSAMHPYLYWDRVRYKNWPSDVKPEEGWAVIKNFRTAFPFRTQSVIRDEQDNHYSWLQGLPWLDQLFHQIDMELGGNLRTLQPDLDEHMRGRLIARGVMEEAIASSQMEGANTTRKAAKRMIQEGRKPHTTDERMVLNNYNAMLTIEQDLKRQPLSLDMLFQLHAMLTEGTLENPNEVGAFRDDENVTELDKIAVRDALDGTIWFMPPKISFVKKEIQRLIAYANDDITVREEAFVHPVIKAITLHFWMGYLHPFSDGNGRLARALFYWYLLKNDYWGFAYLPLSKVIKESKKQYGLAYVYAEQDDYDLTYFVDYNARKIRQAMRDFREYVKHRGEENSRMARLARKQHKLNNRQIQLLRYFGQKENESTSTKMHMNVNRISRLTALKDLKELEQLGFLTSERIGREVHYFGTDKVPELFSRA